MASETGNGRPSAWRRVTPVLAALGLSLLLGAGLLWPYIFSLLPGPAGAVAAVVVTIAVGFLCLLVYYSFEAWRMRRGAWRRR